MKAAVAAAVLILLGACAEIGLPQATLESDHPLNGRIWRPETQSFVSELTAYEALNEANYVLLGEKHDNSVHHRLQAKAVREIIKSGGLPWIAFEMIDNSQWKALNKFLASGPDNAYGLGAALDWENSGWPDWGYYAPIANAALDADLPLLPANFPRSTARFIGSKGFLALGKTTVSSTGLAKSLPKALDKSLMDELYASHCRMMPRKRLRGVARVQHARDALMAATLAQDQHVVLIAGAGHTRKDRGVPFYLRYLKPKKKIVSVAYVEVEKSLTKPEGYAKIYHADRLPFDLVWFTARVDNIDPCEKFKSQLQKMKKKKTE